MNIIKFLEEKHGAVCDRYEVNDGIITMELRVVRHDFEYSTKLLCTMEDEKIVSYEFLWEWHRKSKGVETVVFKSVTQTVHHNNSAAPVRRPVRRTVAEINKQAAMA